MMCQLLKHSLPKVLHSKGFKRKNPLYSIVPMGKNVGVGTKTKKYVIFDYFLFAKHYIIYV